MSDDDPDEVPTGLPDETVVAEAVAAVEDGDEAEHDDRTEAAEPVETTEAGPDLTAELAEVRAGVEAMLPDLAATAREETLATGLAEIRKGLDEVARLSRRADEHVAELHTENQRLRAGELASAMRPMMRDLVRLHDEVAQLTSASHPEAHGDLQLVGSRLLDTLARWGLSPFVPAIGDALDARSHQGVGRVVSADGEPGTIATVRRPGFAHEDGHTFRPAEVEVFVALPDPPAAPDRPPAPDAPPPPDPPAAEQTEE